MEENFSKTDTDKFPESIREMIRQEINSVLQTHPRTETTEELVPTSVVLEKVLISEAKFMRLRALSSKKSADNLVFAIGIMERPNVKRFKVCQVYRYRVR